MLKFQRRGSKVGDTVFHLSTSHDTCLRKCKYCYNHKSIAMYKNTGINYDNNTLAIINRETLPKIPRNKIAGRFSLNGDFSFKCIEDSIYYISEWKRIALENPTVQIFGYTKSWQDEKLLPYLEDFKSIANVVLRASVDEKTGYNVPTGWTIAGVKTQKAIDSLKGKKYFTCKFTNKEHKMYKLQCDKCKICLSSKTQNVPVFFDQH